MKQSAHSYVIVFGGNHHARIDCTIGRSKALTGFILVLCAHCLLAWDICEELMSLRGCLSGGPVLE